MFVIHPAGDNLRPLLTLATSNEKGFKAIGIEVMNPLGLESCKMWGRKFYIF